MIRRRRAESRFTSPARATVGPPRLRAFSVRVKRSAARQCVICDRTSGLQTAHLIAVSEAPQLALRRRNAVLLCRADHLAFDSWVGVIPPGSRLWVDARPRIARNPLAFGLLVAERESLRIAYRLA
jgi:5-methylcytosine-specific restriction endonuclease McrA